MMSWTRFHMKNFKFWSDVAAAQIDAAVTIAHRLRILADTSTPKARRRATREAKAMVAEKIAAIGEGGLEGARSAARSSTALLGHPAVAASALTGIGREMFEPSRRRVRANARRLTRDRAE